MIRIGIDAGSTTLKVYAIDTNTETVIYKSYNRHYAKVVELLIKELECIKEIVGQQEVMVAVTGSAGYGIAEKIDVLFVQEVFAVAYLVTSFYEDVDCVIELGGEDAKIIFLKGGLEQRMNATCAGGTGAFIDQMATLMNISVSELDALSQKSKMSYPIASRCGVFAKSDIQPLLNQGARKEDISKSIFDAVVEQTIAGLAQGRNIEGKVLFLGGPLYFYKGLRESFLQRLELGDNAVFPEDANYFVAQGCVAYLEKENNKSLTCDELIDRLKSIKAMSHSTGRLRPLFNGEKEYLTFKERHEKYTFSEGDITTYEGNAYLGIDAGSTTTKILLIGEDNQILYQYYGSNKGNPLEITRRKLEEIYKLCSNKIQIKGSAVTGYGEELIKEAYGIDHGIVETMAHFTAAKYFEKKVSFILDVGGQDIKCFKIKNGAIEEIILNEACSSGCGSFIQTFASQMGYKVEEFAKLAIQAKKPVDLGSRCTVFMNSAVKQAQKEGASIEDLSAGIAISVIKNTLYKVIRVSNIEELGGHIVVQGGTFYNDAVLRSLEQEIGKEVIRPKTAGIMGAIGAALYAKDNQIKTKLISEREIKDFEHHSNTTRCKGCSNKCNLIINNFNTGKTYLSGNRCEKVTGNNENNNLPNLYRYKYQQLRSFESLQGKRGLIGIPVVLNMYENLPFWVAMLKELGFGVMLSDESSKSLYVRGQSSIASDTVCYPAKLVHGHIENLIDKGIKNIFYPCMSYNIDEGISDNCFNCPVVAYYPEVIKGNLGRIQSVNMMMPYLDMNNRVSLEKTLYSEFKQNFADISKKEVSKAIEKGWEAYRGYKKSVLDEGHKAIEYARKNQKPIIVLAGRPYHIDPEINHGIDQQINNLGAVVISEDSIPLQNKLDLNLLNQWTYQARLYNAANIVKEYQNMQLVQLVSFGCGTDAITSDEVKDLLISNDEIYTQIKIDENSNLGAAKIRLRSMFAAGGSCGGENGKCNQK